VGDALANGAAARRRGNAEKIIANSRNGRGRERRVVEGRIEQFRARKKPKKKPRRSACG
jgi:hypothetical protein